MKAQKAEAEDLRKQISEASAEAVHADEETAARLERCLHEEQAQAGQERKELLSLISVLVDQSAARQDSRVAAKVRNARRDMTDSRSTFQASKEAYSEGMDGWAKKETSLIESIMKSKESVKIKLKEDWRAIDERNTSIQTTTKSVHEETIRIVDGQMQDMSKQMQALDDFVTRARSQNERHHVTHLDSLQDLASNVHQSYSSISDHFTTTYDRVRDVGSDISLKSSEVQASLPRLDANLKQPLADLRNQISAAPLQEYTVTGETPQKTTYKYPTTLPSTIAPNKFFSGNHTASLPAPTHSPNKSPSKGPVYTDAPSPDNAPGSSSPSKSKDDPRSLREISLNVSAALNRNNSDSAAPVLVSVKPEIDFSASMPPPLKRQATESKLPTKLRGGGGVGVVKLEGRENLSASVGSRRRLRSSPTE